MYMAKARVFTYIHIRFSDNNHTLLQELDNDISSFENINGEQSYSFNNSSAFRGFPVH